MLKRWKLSAKAKLLTFKGFRAEQRGPWLFTLLEGKAWDACEHLSLEDLSKEGGEEALWKILEPRFPEKEPYDQMGEALGAVFALAAKENEDLKSWTGRVRDTFDQCQRKGQVTFPSQAKGWILLHCAGMSEEQRAIVKAKTQGQLDFEVVSQALRSCFPEFKAPAGRKKAIGMFQVDEIAEINTSGRQADEDDIDFADVEAFLSEHQQVVGSDEPTFSAGVNVERRLQSCDKADSLDQCTKKREVFESRWKSSRNAQNADAVGRSDSGNVSAKLQCLTRPLLPAAPVNPPEQAMFNMKPTHLSPHLWVLPRYSTAERDDTHAILASGLVSSPGFGVVDSGRGKTLIGRDTLQQLETLVSKCGFGPVKL